ncbi:MAG: AMP-binding protein [Sandaracinaceae bacterium]|nr:AMP-binding protein [Sandaracinaceae bacterium]
MLDLGPGIPVTPTAPKARTVGEMFWLRAAPPAPAPALYFNDAGQWRALSWADFYDRAARVAKGLRELGIEPGQRVAILGPTQPAWAIYDLGAQLGGAVSFGIYPKQSPEQVRYLLEHSEARVVFVADPEELDTVLAAAAGVEDLKAIVPWTEELFRASAHRDPRIASPGRFEGERLSEQEIRATQASRDPDETAIFIYTSGDHGPAQGRHDQPPQHPLVAHGCGGRDALLGERRLHALLADGALRRAHPRLLRPRERRDPGRVRTEHGHGARRSAARAADALRLGAAHLREGVREDPLGAREEAARGAQALRVGRLGGQAARALPGGGARRAGAAGGAVRGGGPAGLPQDPAGLRRARAADDHRRGADRAGDPGVLLGRGPPRSTRPTA